MNQLIKNQKAGLPVYLFEVEEGLKRSKNTTQAHLVLTLFDGSFRHITLHLPTSVVDDAEFTLVESFILARIYNLLSTYGGLELTVYSDHASLWYTRVFTHLSTHFQIDSKRSERFGYGKAVNVIERMLEGLTREVNPTFSIHLRSITEYQSLPNHASPVPTDSILHVFKEVTKVGDSLLCGMDIGGTDIKIAVSRGEQILFFKEYDWNPASFTTMHELIDPILLLMELMQLQVQYLTEPAAFDAPLCEMLFRAMAATSTVDDLKAIKGVKKDLPLFDGLGLCFPDIVIRNKIVGGEVYKTRGIRSNTEIDYEQEFRKLADLNVLLARFCTKPECVHMTNDGPMAAFTAGVELAASPSAGDVEYGVFAHTLGTELGTGWVDEHGMIPEMPLEIYNYIVDLGSIHQRAYHPDDLRSLNNFNTGLPGTLQKFTSQSGVFRLALMYFENARPDLYQELLDRGFVKQQGDMLIVPTEPVDLRKPFLEYMMGLVAQHVSVEADQIFREIGHALAATWFETERLLEPKAKNRVLFGRLVKNERCFELMQEGFTEYVEHAQLLVADDSIANTTFMRQLEEDPHYTIAQFAQAVGALYFANR